MITENTGRGRNLLWGATFTAMSMSCFSLAAYAADAEKEKENLEEVVVSGVRASLDNAQAIKKASAQVVDSVVAEDVGKLPDNTVAEALARVTGIQVRRDGSEANTLLIRGLPDIVTLLNGREVFTTFQRFIQLADVPANMLRRVDVYKTNGAEYLDGGLAGMIDVRTRHPFDSPGLHVNGNARAIFSDKAKKTDPDLGATFSDTWSVGGGQFGALVGMSFKEAHYHEERAFNVAPDFQTRCGGGAPSALAVNCGFFNAAHPAPVADFAGPFVMGYIPIKGDRRRTAGNFALEWRPNDATKLYAEGFATDYKNNFELDFLVGLPFLGDGNISGTVFPGTNQMSTLTNENVFTIMSTQANAAHSLTEQFAVGGSYDVNNLRFSTDLATTSSTYDWRNPILDTGTVVPNVFVNTNLGGTAILNYGGPAGYNIKDPSHYTLANFFDNYGNDTGHALDWRGDVVWTPASLGILTDVRGGLRYADRKAGSIKSYLGGTGGPRSVVTVNSIPGLAGLSDPMASGGPDYGTTQWFTPSAAYLLSNTNTIRAAFGLGVRPLDPGSYFSDKEVTQAGYVQASLGGNAGTLPWSAVVGVRAVRTDQTLQGNVSQVQVVGGPLVYTPIIVDNQGTDVLPNANFKISLTPDLIGRLGLGRTITRPNFPDLNPGVSLSTVISNTTGLTGNGGNPRLKPVKSNNIDAALEWYFARAGSLTATVFRRKFDGYVQPSFGYETYGGLSYRVSRPGNTGSGNLNGLEVGYQQFYDKLPGILGGLGLQANFTYIDGKTANLATGADRTITGVSKTSFNIIALYEKAAWSGRLAYNWRSKFIDTYAFATNTNPVTGVVTNFNLWARATAQMDGSVSYQLNKKVTLTFEAVNILDTKFKDYFNNPNLYPRDTRRYDRTFELGLRASL